LIGNKLTPSTGYGKVGEDDKSHGCSTNSIESGEVEDAKIY
jgi:hypothetical protein